MRQLLEESPEITALFCRNDLLALGAMRGVASLGLRVPEDLSIVGFDNDPWTALLPITLTTMSSPLGEMADRVASVLGARIDGDQSERRRVLLPFELIARESTAPAPAAVTARSQP